MQAKRHPQNSITKRVFAGLLSVWLSGIVFLFCCGMPMTQTAKAAETESCPLAKMSHYCDKSSGDKSPTDENALRLETFQTDKPTFDCCGFLPQVFDKARKAEPIQKSIAITEKTVIETPTLAFVKIEPNAFFKYRPRPLNRSGTYLKNRVFRI